MTAGERPEGGDTGTDEGAPHDHGMSGFAPFQLLCLGLAAQAQVALGLHPDPTTGQTDKDLGAARQAIDLLAVLEEKTKGNLEPDESALLGGLLTELRLAYVHEAR